MTTILTIPVFIDITIPFVKSNPVTDELDGLIIIYDSKYII